MTAFFNIIILLGALQGLIFSGLLFSSAKDHWRNRLLAWLLLLTAVASLHLFGIQAGWFDQPLIHLIYIFIPTIVIMPVGPLVYFYVKSSLQPDYQLSRKDRVHFYPAIIDCGTQLAAIIFILGLLTHLIPNNPVPWGQFVDAYNVYSDIPRWLSITIYVGLAAREIQSTPQPPPQIKWLRQLIRVFLVFQCIWLLYLIPYVIPHYTDIMLSRFDWYPIYVPLAIVIYWLGIKGYIVSRTSFITPSKPKAQLPLQSGFIERTTGSLIRAMEQDHLYLDPALTVATLSAHTGIAQRQVSAILNQHLNKSFNEFVNEYRIHAIKERLLKGESRNLTIAGMAYECGFNSLPTFQRAFKAIIGQTPSEFLSNCQQNGS